MIEVLEIIFMPTKRSVAALRQLQNLWNARGYVVELWRGGPYMRLLAPLGDESWRAEMSEV